MIVIKQLKSFAAIYIIFLLQSIIFENIKILSVTPNLLLAAVIIAAVFLNDTQAALLGAFAGLLTDVVCSRVFGVHIILYMLLAAAVSHFVNKGVYNSPIFMGLCSFEFSAAYIVVESVLPTIFGYSVNLGRIAADILICGIISFVAAFVFTYILNKAEARKKKLAEVADNE